MPFLILHILIEFCNAYSVKKERMMGQAFSLFIANQTIANRDPE